MKTWDDIKRETEKKAKNLWADDDEEYSDTHSEYNTLTRTHTLQISESVSESNPIEHKRSYSEAVSNRKTTHSDNNISVRLNVIEETIKSDTVCPPSPLVVPGNPIGIRSIQSIMMSATQMNLSHFHTAGMSSALISQLGQLRHKVSECVSESSSVRLQLRVPSAAEAMNSVYTKNNTSMKFTMQKQYLEKNNSDTKCLSCPSQCFQSTFEQLRYIRKKLIGASLGHFVRRIGSNLTGLNDRENIWYSASPKKSLCPSGSISTEVPKVLLRFYIDFNKMYNHGLTLENLAQEVFGSDCQWNVSPDFMGMIDISVPPDTYYISQWLSRTKNRVCGTSYVLSCDLLGDSVSTRKTHSDTHPYTGCTSECPNSVGVNSYFFTRGTNVLAACKVPGIDKTTLKLNNVISVEKNFGIEAAANILAELTGNVIISDFMARTGTVLPFSKHSSEVSSKGLLTSMGFERPKEDIQREINSESSSVRLHVESVYEHIITGKDPPLGFMTFRRKLEEP